VFWTLGNPASSGVGSGVCLGLGILTRIFDFFFLIFTHNTLLTRESLIILQLVRVWWKLDDFSMNFGRHVVLLELSKFRLILLLELHQDLVHRGCTVARLLLEQFSLLLEQFLMWFLSGKNLTFSRKFLGFFLFGFLANPNQMDQCGWHKVFLEHVSMLLELFHVLLEQFWLKFSTGENVRFSRKFHGIFSPRISG
jgi:hypothetical protein